MSCSESSLRHASGPVSIAFHLARTSNRRKVHSPVGFGLGTCGLAAIVLVSFGWIVLYPLAVGLLGTATSARNDP